MNGVTITMEAGPQTIPMNKLQDGQIGIITSGCYKGRVVQGCGESIIAIGEGYGHSWSGVRYPDSGCTHPVRILPPGTVLRIN